MALFRETNVEHKNVDENTPQGTFLDVRMAHGTRARAHLVARVVLLLPAHDALTAALRLCISRADRPV
jgi:hypothetical protein